MLKKIKDEYKFLLPLIILFLVNVFLFWLKQGSLVIDTGREFYIPSQMLKGHVLYKDIFNIYGPLSYQVNSLAFLLFGQKITSLLIFGVVNSFVMLLTLYFISREFLSKSFSSLIVILVMFSSVFGADLFNFNLPYSYAISYGLSSILLSVFFLIKYIKTPQNVFAYLACFFAGVSLANKYEYILYPLILLYVFFFVAPLGKKELLKSLGCFLLVPLLSFGVLFLQGLTFADVYNCILIIKKMSSCITLKYFYSNFVGFFFNPKLAAFYLTRFGFLVVLFSLLYSAILFEKRIQTVSAKNVFKIIYFGITFIALFFINTYSLGFFPILNLFLLLIFFKPVYENKAVFILALCAFITSLKTFFGLNINLYGAFTFPLLLVSIMVLINGIIIPLSKDEVFKENIKKTLMVLLMAFIALFVLRDFISLMNKTQVLTTPKGKFYSYPFIVEPNQELVDYIIQNTNKNDKVVILPESPFVNFLTDRDSDNYYNSLIPLYFETFGEQNVINHFSKTRPEYFVFNNRNTQDYGFEYICKDYAIGLCKFVNTNYSLVKTTGREYRMLIYKRKDLK